MGGGWGEVELVNGFQLGAHGLEAVVLFDGGAGVGSESLPEFGVEEEFLECVGEGCGIGRWDEESGGAVGDDFGDSADLGADDSAAHGLGLEEDLGDSFVGGGWEDDDIGAGEDLRDIFAVAEAEDLVGFGGGEGADVVVDALSAGAIAGEDELEGGVAGGEEVGGLEEDFVTFPAAEDGDHGDDRGLAGCLPFRTEGGREGGVESGQVDAGGDAGDAVGLEVEFLDEAAGDALAGGEDVVGEVVEGESAEEAVGVIDLDVAGADEERDFGEACGDGGDPAVAGAVGVDDVGLGGFEPAGELEDGGGVGGFVIGEVEDGESGFVGAGGEGRVGWGGEEEVVAAVAHGPHFGEDADFLTTPAAGGFGMNDGELPGHGGGGRDGQRGVAVRVSQPDWRKRSQTWAGVISRTSRFSE